ncbi:CaiB/BaiF CoA transferase family protein [Plastoroseomonas hellenica]|uniref:CaiB/BaiF CoA transferase family protein n=1 Tax=Plastoroseomonas hellenica TaxID=2687306 RepID=UPI001BAA2465|nr:CoA transferase [Plastoroseomonas hellenica]MBR0644033.1 CoA transferase [Plastoroseomonas hellenica]
MPDPLPLAGRFAVEIGHSLAGPFCGAILADLGATVLKVESAGKGDHARDWGPPFIEGAAALFHAVNRGKLSVTADLRDPATAEALRWIILERADILLQNLKVGTLEEAGLGAEGLLAAKPSLVICNIGAFGRNGPKRSAPGYDPLIQAASGLMSMNGHPGAPPARLPVAVNDVGTGIWGALGILAALLRCTTTGRGGVVDVSLYETALNWMGVPIADHLASGALPKRYGSGVGNIVPYQVFDCADGELLIAAGNDLLFGKLCGVLGLDALATDPRFATNGGRVENRDALIPALMEATRGWPVAMLTAALEKARIPCGPVQDVATALADPQTEALGIIAATPGDGVRTVALPLSFDGSRPPLSGRAPRLGEHQSILDKAKDRRR